MRTYLHALRRPGAARRAEARARARRRAALRHLGRLRLGAGLPRLPARRAAPDADQRAHGGDLRAPRRRALRPRARARPEGAEGRRAPAAERAPHLRLRAARGRPLDAGAFAPRFDVLHRTFLGYPRRSRRPQRTARFFQLYRDIAADHAQGRSQVALHARRSRVGGGLLRPRAPPRVSPLLKPEDPAAGASERPPHEDHSTHVPPGARAGAAAALVGLPAHDAHGRRRRARTRPSSSSSSSPWAAGT